MSKIKFILGCYLLVSGSINLHAQTTLYVKLKNSTQTSYALTGIQNITFTGANMQVNKTDGNTDLVALGDIRYLNFQNITGILDASASKSFNLSLYPNPLVENTLTINYELTTSGPVLIEIVNVNGAVVKQMTEQGSAGKNDACPEVKDLPSGVYTCRISMGKQAGSEKIIKQ